MLRNIILFVASPVIENNKGLVKTSVSKNTDYLIYSDNTSSKYIKANELGVICILREDFFNYFK